MKTNKGSALPLIVFSVFAVIALTIAGFFIFRGDSDTEDIQSSVEDALLSDERVQGVLATDVTISKEVGQFVRGFLTDSNDGRRKTFYAIKIGDDWRIVDIVEGPVSCERFTRIGFPADFISDCRLSFPDAVTVAEIDSTLDSFILEGVSLQVIGVVDELVLDEEGGTLSLTISSGGEETTIEADIDDIPDLGPGDIVVINTEIIDEPNQDSGSGNVNNNNNQSGNSINVISITKVGEGDEDVTDNNSNNPLPQEQGGGNTNATSTNQGNTGNENGNTGNGGGNTGGTILKINAPNPAPPTDQFINVFDIDNSLDDVMIEGSF